MLCFHSMNEMPVLVLSAGFFLGVHTNCNGFLFDGFFVVGGGPSTKAVVLEVLSLTALSLRIPFVLGGYERKTVLY